MCITDGSSTRNMWAMRHACIVCNVMHAPASCLYMHDRILAPSDCPLAPGVFTDAFSLLSDLYSHMITATDAHHATRAIHTAWLSLFTHDEMTHLSQLIPTLHDARNYANRMGHAQSRSEQMLFDAVNDVSMGGV